MAEVFLEPLLRWMRLRRIIGHIPPQSVVLDIGCGHKIGFLRAISPRIRKGYGVDFKVLSQSFDNLEIRQMTFQDHDRLPFDDASMDIVTMLAVLEHIEAEADMLQEIYRAKTGRKAADYCSLCVESACFGISFLSAQAGRSV
jgi:ubiquinone/menaquinone biosynthesis C-methylase UbiE